MALELYELCETFKQLPQPGGLLNQDYVQVMLLQAAHLGAKKAEAALHKQAENKSRPKRR